MGAGAGLPDGRAQIRRTAFRIRQEDRPGTRDRPQFGARVGKEIARPQDARTKKGALGALFIGASDAPSSRLRRLARAVPSFRGAAEGGEPGTHIPEACVYVGVDGPRRHRMCQAVMVEQRSQGSRPMMIIRIGLDTSKHVFQVHGVDESEQAVLRRQVRRSEMAKFFGKLAPARIGLEACGASHHWARVLRGLGHAVVLIAPQYVKPYVKRGKNDAIDAAAICEAMSRPGMRFVPIKSAEQQASLMVLRVRDLLVKQRTAVINAIRGHAAEFGVSAAKGPV